MFDIGFSELLVCAVVALVVLGPEKLPRVARTLGRWSGQAKGYLRNLSAELDRESQLAELKKELEAAHRAIRDSAVDFNSAAQHQIDGVAEEVRSTVDGVKKVTVVDNSGETPALDAPAAASDTTTTNPAGEPPKPQP